MSYRITDADRSFFWSQGYYVLKQILPPALMRDLRREADKAREIARKTRGPRAQRLQPVGRYDELDQKVFRDYAELPELNDAIHQLLSPRHYYGTPGMLGILIEPQDVPSGTDWHRDIRETTLGIDPEEFRRIFADPNYGNQVNCALYDDACAWFVPGSHLRMWDLPGETEAAKNTPFLPDGSHWEKFTPEELERKHKTYCEAMPGAVQLHLRAGDFAIYRPLGWHLGSYVPYQRRATLHDIIYTPECEAWVKRWRDSQAAAKAKV